MTVTETKLTSGIVSRPDILGGEPIIEGTRTPVRAVVENWNLGIPVEEIPVHLPRLTLKNVFESLLYYLDHKEEIRDHIKRNHIPPEWRGKRLNPKTGEIVPFE